MNIINLDEKGNQVEKLYNVDSILVSGSHLVYCSELKRFIHVDELNTACATDIKCDNLTCLITSDHTIPIGKWIFHDWEDNNGSPAKSF